MIRYQVSLRPTPEDRRPVLVGDLVKRLETLLREAYPEGRGFSHRTTWTRAPRAHTRATEELRERCQEARVKVSRGADWGLVVDVSPQDLWHNVLWLRASILPPRLERWRARAHWVGALLGAALAIPLVAYWLNTGWRPTNPRAPIGVIGGGTLAGSAVLLTLVNAAHLYYEWRLRPDLDRAAGFFARAWQSLSGMYSNLLPLESRRSPTLHQAAVAAAMAAVAAASYWGYWQIEPATTAQWTAMIGVGVVGAVAAFGAVCFSLFTLFDFIGVEVGGSDLKRGD